MDDLKAIGHLISLLRTQRKLSQSELAKLVGVNQGTISRIEKGHPHLKLELYNRILNGLNLSLLDKDEKHLSNDFEWMYQNYENFTGNHFSEIDNLYHQINSYDFIHIKEYPILQLIELFYHYVHKNYQVLDELVLTVQLLEQFYSDFLWMRYQQMMGLVYFLKNEYELALTYLENAFIYCEKDRINEGLVYYHYGYIHFFIGNYTTCMLALTKAEKIYTLKNNSNRLKNIAYLTGLVYMNDRNYEESEQIFIKLLNDKAFLENNKSAFYILIRNLGLLNYYKKSYEKAIHYFEQLYQDEKNNSKTVILFMLLSLSHIDKFSYEMYIAELTKQQDKDIKAIVDIVNDIQNFKINPNLINKLLEQINSYNRDRFINYLIEEYGEAIYNSRKYSTFKRIFDLFLELKVKVQYGIF